MNDSLGLSANFVRMSLRTLKKNKLASLVNLGGLSVGLTGCLLIGLFIVNELGYDRHYAHADKLYRITSEYNKDGSKVGSAQTDANVASLMEGLPEIHRAVRILPSAEGFLFFGEKAFKEMILYADPTAVDVFGLEVIAGDRSTCLKAPSSVVISESSALRFFGKNWMDTPVLGRVIEYDGRIPMTITGIFRDMTHRAHIRSDLFASLPSGHENWMESGSKVYTYALLHEDVDVETCGRKLKDLAKTVPADGGYQTRLRLQPVTDIYLFSSLEDENGIQGNVKNIYSLLLVAIFLIVTTVTNFVNLNAAHSIRRVKEVGVRKVLGAHLWQLRYQFLMETTIVSMIAVCLATIAVMFTLPFFNHLTGKDLQPGSLFTLEAFVLAVGLTVTVSILAGLYPSVCLSAKKPAAALRGGSKGPGVLGLRKGLVVFQFAVSVIMLAMSIAAVKQIQFINTRPPGFDKLNTITLANPYMLGSTDEIIRFKNELLTLDGIENVSITGYTPSQKRWGNLTITYPGRNRNNSYAQPASWLIVDESFVRTMDLALVAGRDFRRTHEHDRESIIVNETAVAQFGLNEDGKDPIGAELSYRNTGKDTDEHFTVVGVVRDFNFGSLHDRVKPVVMRLGYHRFEMAVRLSSTHPAQRTIEGIGALWSKALPAIPFEYSYIKDRYDRLHASDTAASRLFWIFCLTTIIISALGLFSVMTYEVAARMKEIGIRKLLGATIWNISSQLCSRYLTLIIMVYCAALPLSWILVGNWIADFAYKTEISWWIFALAGGVMFVLAAVTLGYQSIRASLANPVDNLRHE